MASQLCKITVSRLPIVAAMLMAVGSIHEGVEAQSRYSTGLHSPSQSVSPDAMSSNGRYSSISSPYAYGAASSIALGQQFQQWIDWEPHYTLVPGDQLDIVVGSAPELSRTLTVGPDGRIVMPMTHPIMAAGQTFTQVQSALMAQLGQQLRDPRVSVTPRAYAPEQIYVGGQVGQPGTYTINNRIGALEAILMAGGKRSTAKTREVAVLRRAPNGGMMMRTVNLRNGLKDIYAYNDTIQLRRGDIVFVPATRLAEVGQFVQSVRSALPFEFNLSYQLGPGANANNVDPAIMP